MRSPECVLLYAAAAIAIAAHPQNVTDILADPHALLGDQTSVTLALNSAMKQGTNGVYTGGKGIIVRTPDFFSNSGNKVVPGSFWVNDIYVPNALYPTGNPWCPHGSSDGFQNIDWSKCPFSGGIGPWHYATVAAVIGDDGMSKLFDDWGNVQTQTWGWGVFYAADANSCDQRCRNLGSKGGYDCPNYWVPYGGTPQKDMTKHGAGVYNQGNPYAGKDGGGAGCHFDTQRGIFDQADAITANNQNLVQNGDCECNYIFRDDWSHWVTDWIQNSAQKKDETWRDWLANSGKRAPAWAVDTTMCWVNNPRDMIRLQNALWDQHTAWLNGEAPQWSQTDPEPYWGWNEVPVDRQKVESPSYWDTIMIKLPITLTSVTQLGAAAQKQLEGQLNAWRMNKALLLGGQYAQSRPGSYIVFASELKFNTPGASLDKYYRQFYCETWMTPTKWFRIVSRNDVGSESCYIESGPQLLIPDVVV